jgi:Rrf2 family nitric oxide-sensitive transcriptional repressor
MQLTRFTDYSLRTLMYLAARPAEMSSVKAIADHYGISRNHLVKVIHCLAKLGYIETTKGRGGGIRIARGAESLRLGDLVVQLEPNMTLVECFDPETNSCRITSSCRLKHYLSQASRSFIESLNRYTLADTLFEGNVQNTSEL